MAEFESREKMLAAKHHQRMQQVRRVPKLKQKGEYHLDPQTGETKETKMGLFHEVRCCEILLTAPSMCQMEKRGLARAQQMKGDLASAPD